MTSLKMTKTYDFYVYHKNKYSSLVNSTLGIAGVSEFRVFLSLLWFYAVTYFLIRIIAK